MYILRLSVIGMQSQFSPGNIVSRIDFTMYALFINAEAYFKAKQRGINLNVLAPETLIFSYVNIL